MSAYTLILYIFDNTEYTMYKYSPQLGDRKFYRLAETDIPECKMQFLYEQKKYSMFG